MTGCKGARSWPCRQKTGSPPPAATLRSPSMPRISVEEARQRSALPSYGGNDLGWGEQWLCLAFPRWARDRFGRFPSGIPNVSRRFISCSRQSTDHTQCTPHNLLDEFRWARAFRHCRCRLDLLATAYLRLRFEQAAALVARPRWCVRGLSPFKGGQRVAAVSDNFAERENSAARFISAPFACFTSSQSCSSVAAMPQNAITSHQSLPK